MVLMGGGTVLSSALTLGEVNRPEPPLQGRSGDRHPAYSSSSALPT
jgi:hypothetical protein